MNTEKIFESLKGELETKIGTPSCKLWNETHKNCEGCPSYKACKEYLVRIAQYTQTELIASGDLPEDYDLDWGKEE